MQLITKLAAVLCLISLMSTAFANQDAITTDVIRSSDDLPKIEDLNWLNQKFLEKQRAAIEELTRQHYGRGLSGDKRDLALLQRVIDDKLIPASDTPMLQALGVVLGDAYVSDIKEFQWKVYTDDLGPTHAVCVKSTKECLFVLTMLSRRMEVGIQPKVDTIYNKGLSLMEKVLPKTPYSAH